ncbi:hypothetical protein GW937_00375 [Candidatus Kaiserbacteria bacterium]|nr:hypothetical protein [Candidatus Kaiserbacteria bacterium]NCT01966.1 hypothetical protein [Candidatus Parcubacteria bacterium]
MSLFGIGHSDDRYGVIIDVGSGSVLTAIIHSDPQEKQPTIIWAHREQVPLRNINSLEQSAKALVAALIDASMLLDSEGRSALRENNPSAKLTRVQCGISAPWSYTITKTINYKQDEVFTISDELIEDLLTTINSKIENDLQNSEPLRGLGLQTITNATVDVRANGYRANNLEGEKVQELSISRVNVVTHGYMVDALDEISDKLFTGSDLHKTSYIFMLNTVANELLQLNNDHCLVDVTYEATEIGVVRDGVLTYCTHTPFGSYSLAREISAAINVPIYEAFGYLHTEKPYNFKLSLSTTQLKEIDEIFEAYTARVTELFHETGDELSIPKHITIHSDLNSETLFTDIIDHAVKRATKAKPFISKISSEIFEKYYRNSEVGPQKPLSTDTAMLVSAQFFHNDWNRPTFKFL